MNIAIIPARGGSKRLPNKNILFLNKEETFEYDLKKLIICIILMILNSSIYKSDIKIFYVLN